MLYWYLPIDRYGIIICVIRYHTQKGIRKGGDVIAGPERGVSY